MSGLNFKLKRKTTFGVHTFILNKDEFDFTGTTISFIVKNKNNIIFELNPDVIIYSNSCNFELYKSAFETTNLEIGSHKLELFITFPDAKVRCIEGTFNIYD